MKSKVGATRDWGGFSPPDLNEPPSASKLLDTVRTFIMSIIFIKLSPSLEKGKREIRSWDGSSCKCFIYN